MHDDLIVEGALQASFWVAMIWMWIINPGTIIIGYYFRDRSNDE